MREVQSSSSEGFTWSGSLAFLAVSGVRPLLRFIHHQANKIHTYRGKHTITLILCIFNKNGHIVFEMLFKVYE